jgi:hypothetical protein
MPDLFDTNITQTLAADKKLLEQTQVPIITLSASFREDLKKMHGLANNETSTDVVLSRAHYSMALGVAQEAWQGKVDAKKCWIVDPTNYVSKDDWMSVRLTEEIGKTIARHSFLKKAKDMVDRFGRKKLPILDSITPALLYLSERIERPILSFHTSVGNVLVGQGKRVLQMVTDPHVREDYLDFGELDSKYWCVFDDKTKIELLEKAALIDKAVDPERIFVTGPPIDPRIVAARSKKQPWRSGPLKLCITTGGLGTNKAEMLQLLSVLLPELYKSNPPYELLVYTSTQRDIYMSVLELAGKQQITVSPLAKTDAKLRVIYHPQIVDANELLIQYGFPWAHGFVTKPSGDMAYDAVASGSFLLTLAEWGVWEVAIREHFEHLDISRRLLLDDVKDQLEVLMSAQGKAQSWIEGAMRNALSLPASFTSGAKTILKTYQKLV